MSINLTSYSDLRAATFVRIDVDEYRTTSSGSYTSQVLRFSDHSTTFSINSETYTPVGRLMSITDTTSELRSTGNSITITLSGIPNSSIAEIIHSKLKGSTVNIYRAYFTSAGTQIGTTQSRWVGAVGNYALDEDYDVLNTTATNSIQLDCICTVELLQNKLAGRKTNPTSMQSFFANDTSFDRVPGLVDAQFDFGGSR
jgi:hypothetical protein